MVYYILIFMLLLKSLNFFLYGLFISCKRNICLLYDEWTYGGGRWIFYLVFFVVLWNNLSSDIFVI